MHIQPKAKLAAKRLESIPPFHVMDLLAKAQAMQSKGQDILHMEVGEPDFPTPQPILDAARDFLAQGQVRYTPALGLPELRTAISDFYETRFGAQVSPDRIIITAGASGALLLAVATLTNPGEAWLLTDPGYPCNRQFIETLGGEVITLEVDARTRYQPEVEMIEKAWTPSSKALLLASPSNPTGTMISPENLDLLGNKVVELGGCLVVDEIYQGLTYGAPSSSVLARRNDAFVVNSFSKYFGMTGWRLGWLVVPEHYTRHVEKLAQHLFIAASTPAQHAALAAFRPDTLAILETRRQAFETRRNTLLKGLKHLGFGIDTQPTGAFYVYANTRNLGRDSMSLAHHLLEHALVATTPGADFGRFRASEHLRLAYTIDVDRINEAIRRIQAAL